MDPASESPQDPTKGTVAVNTRRETSPAVAPFPSNPIGLDLIDEQLQHAWAYRDELLNAINLKVLALKSQRNLHAFIHKLPVELLVYIFRLSLPAPETGSYIEALGTLLGVCTHWTTVISAATSLWAVVSSMCSPEFLALSLTKLNSSCPLHIVCEGSTDEEFTHILPQISPHIHRWETADIVMPQTQQGRQYLSAPAPRLRRLHLSVPSGTVRSESNSWPFDIFNGSADRLEELKVTWTCLLWDSPILGGLKSLHLQYCTSIRVSNVIAILNHCPDLTTLIIDDTDITVDMQADPSEAANMTRLENIDFNAAELEGIREVINGFTAPNCKAFKFNFGTVELTDTDDFILSTLAPYFSFFRRMMFEHQKAVIDISNIDDFDIQCSRETDEDDFVGFSLSFSGTPVDILLAFLEQVLGEDESRKPDVRLIIGRDWEEEGRTILDEVPSYCNVVDLWLGAYNVLREFDTESTLHYLARPTALPNLRHLIISGDGWNGQEIKVILRKRYNQASADVVPLRIRFIGRGINAGYSFVRDLKRIAKIEEASCSEKTQRIENKDMIWGLH